MPLERRDFIKFLGLSAGVAAVGIALGQQQVVSSTKSSSKLFFNPVTLPTPLPIEELTDVQEIEFYKNYQVQDELVLPEGYAYHVVAAWGDKVGNSRVGYNNDYLSFIETAPDEGLLVINFEYISGKTWLETYPLVIGQSLPLKEVVAKAKGGQINYQTLPQEDVLREKIREIAKESLIDVGIGIISLKRNSKGKWERTYSQFDRRITGISGLEDQQYLQSTGPATAVFTKNNKKGYEDGLGSKIIGTSQNCAGGTTPWGTVLSAEENFQAQVIEAVLADGTSFDPAKMPFFVSEEEVAGCGNVFALAGNKYGWMVEVDPSNPKDYGTKHTWLGRYRHEAVALKVEAGKPMAVYSGCDRRDGHLYKFISNDRIQNPQDKANSRLFNSGMLYGAQFNSNGTGTWIPLKPNTPINPVLPSQVVGRNQQGVVLLPNPDRTTGGVVKVETDELVTLWAQKFKTLGDLYEGTDREKQGAILIDAHYAATAAGVTCTARPEDVELGPDGSLYIAFTSGTGGSEGGPDKRIFTGNKGEIPYEFGWIMRLEEENNEPESLDFRWSMFALGGVTAEGGVGFSNPDNLLLDGNANLWVVTDMSTSIQNKVIPRSLADNMYSRQLQQVGTLGNNAAWVIPTSGPNASKAYPFAIGPMDAELTGPFFTKDERTLFLSVQHPGEKGGIRKNMSTNVAEFAMLTTRGQEFTQTRIVPNGSNWPGQEADLPPKPAIVAIYRLNGKSLIS